MFAPKNRTRNTITNNVYLFYHERHAIRLFKPDKIFIQQRKYAASPSVRATSTHANPFEISGGFFVCVLHFQFKPSGLFERFSRTVNIDEASDFTNQQISEIIYG